MPALRFANLALKFVLELAAAAAFVAWGADVGDGAWSVVLAMALGVTAVMLWGLFAAPKSQFRLPSVWRIAFELCFFALACGALLALGFRVLGAAFGAVVLINAVLLSAFGDWHE